MNKNTIAKPKHKATEKSVFVKTVHLSESIEGGSAYNIKLFSKTALIYLWMPFSSNSLFKQRA